MAREYMAGYFLSIANHYELTSEHFKETKGYELYANAAEALRAVGLETALTTYLGIQTWGTPRGSSSASRPGSACSAASRRS